MRKKQIVVVLLIFSLFSVVGISLLGTASAKPSDAPVIFEPMKIGDRIRNANYEINFDKKPSGKSPGAESSLDYTVEDTKNWLSLDDWNMWYFFTEFERWDVGTSDNTEIWIQTDRSWPEGDVQGREYPEITTDQVAQLLYEFDNNIYPVDVGYFGDSDYHDGSASLLEAWGYFPAGYYSTGPDGYLSEGKDVILVSNVRDQNFYEDFPYYIAGFYSPTFEGYFDRNIISIDSYQWEERVGPDGDRPYLYEGVIAHEYQHLIHDDFFTPYPDATFMNEGCSMFAEYLCGYPTAWGDINSFLATPDNSLTEWGDQGGINILADYGAALLWATYLNDVVEDTFLQEYIQAGRYYNGIDGKDGGMELLDFLLGQAPYETDFETIFKAWRLANLMGTGYESFDFNDRENEGLEILELKEKWPTDVFGTDFGNTFTILDFDTGVSTLASYGTDYILLSKLKWQYDSELRFDGDEVVNVPHWVYEDGSWYSTPGGAFSNLELLLDVDLSELEASDPAILSIDTEYNIEPYWDYGFVQIWNGLDWETLDDGVYCTPLHEDDADPDIVANLPGLTGDSGGLITIEFDLSAYKGLHTTVVFRYMTDPVANYPGWWIDTVYFNSVPLDDTDLHIPPLPTTSFMVTLIRQDFWDGEYTYSLIADLALDIDNDGFIDLADYLVPLNDDIRKPDVLLLITSRLGPADYKFSVVRT